MIVIGADVHKSTHALAAIDAGTGQLLAERAIQAREQGHLEALRWAHELDEEIVWAIEDCRDLSHHLEAKIPSRKLDYPGQLQRITRRLRAVPQTARGPRRPRAGQAHRCVILIGQTAGAERFASDAHFARMAGVAPIPASSGRRDRHRLHRGGNRQLNRALHIIAITRGRIDPTTRAYLARKEAEGKTRIEAMRCLKRHLARRYHRLLVSPAAEANSAVMRDSGERLPSRQIKEAI
jgi:transposase